MVNSFICGSGTFRHQAEEDDEPCSPCSSTPRKPRKSSSFCRSKEFKNPYADRGLDKFSAVLAELDDRRQKIYTQRGSHDISFVRFVYSNSDSDDWKPIVVRMRDKKQVKHNVADNKNKLMKHKSEELDRHPIESSTSPNEVHQTRNELGDRKTEKKSHSCNMKMDMWRPSYYLPAVVILILLFLAVFGRSFTILCTSLGWYFVPTFDKVSSNLKNPKKKKEYARRASEKNIARDGYVAGDINDRRRGHRKSW